LFTAFANFAIQIDKAGADGIVLFTRFHKVDFDVVELEVLRRVELSNSSDLPLRPREFITGNHGWSTHGGGRHQGNDGGRGCSTVGFSDHAPRSLLSRNDSPGSG